MIASLHKFIYMRLVVLIDTLFKLVNIILICLVASGSIEYTSTVRSEILTKMSSPLP